MKGKKTTMTIRVDEGLKHDAQVLFDDLGLDMTTAVTIFLKQCVLHWKIPFEINYPTPNAETLAAIEECEDAIKHPEKYKSYTNVEEMMEELLK